MIGNDVVDISQSRLESNWQRPGFIRKIFTDDEQQCITNTNDPEILVWLFWSMKEAAYKIYNRQTGIREYIPKKLECKIVNKGSTYFNGQVICFDSIYYTTTIITKDSLHTIAVTSLSDLNNVIETDKKSILKNEFGLPFIFDDSKNIRQDVSVSNHGRFEKTVILRMF